MPSWRWQIPPSPRPLRFLAIGAPLAFAGPAPCLSLSRLLSNLFGIRRSVLSPTTPRTRCFRFPSASGGRNWTFTEWATRIGNDAKTVHEVEEHLCPVFFHPMEFWLGLTIKASKVVLRNGLAGETHANDDHPQVVGQDSVSAMRVDICRRNPNGIVRSLSRYHWAHQSEGQRTECVNALCPFGPTGVARARDDTPSRFFPESTHLIDVAAVVLHVRLEMLYPPSGRKVFSCHKQKYLA